MHNNDNGMHRVARRHAAVAQAKAWVESGTPWSMIYGEMRGNHGDGLEFAVAFLDEPTRLDAAMYLCFGIVEDYDSYHSAIVCNDLEATMDHSGLDGARNLWRIVNFYQKAAPLAAHGGPDHVERWVVRQGLYGGMSEHQLAMFSRERY